MQRWCLDWAHEDFKVYSVPGSKNIFNDFHSRHGAPNGAQFFTLQQHAENVEQKLAAIHAEVEGNPAAQPLETMVHEQKKTSKNEKKQPKQKGRQKPKQRRRRNPRSIEAVGGISSGIQGFHAQRCKVEKLRTVLWRTEFW